MRFSKCLLCTSHTLCELTHIIIKHECHKKPEKLYSYKTLYVKSFCLNFILFIFIQQVLISHLLYTYQCIHVNPNLPVHPTTTTPPYFPPLVSIRLFSTSVSLHLPCKPVHLYHFSRFHTYGLIHDNYFSLSDLLHSVGQSLGPYTSLQITQIRFFFMAE